MNEPTPHPLYGKTLPLLRPMRCRYCTRPADLRYLNADKRRYTEMCSVCAWSRP